MSIKGSVGRQLAPQDHPARAGAHHARSCARRSTAPSTASVRCRRAAAAAEKQLAEQRGHVERAIHEVIENHVRLAGAQGFVTNVGGLVTAAVAIPANITGLTLLQCRMIAGIAHLRGHDLDDPRVRNAILMTLLGEDTVTEMVKKKKLPAPPMALATAPAHDATSTASSPRWSPPTSSPGSPASGSPPPSAAGSPWSAARSAAGADGYATWRVGGTPTASCCRAPGGPGPDAAAPPTASRFAPAAARRFDYGSGAPDRGPSPVAPSARRPTGRASRAWTVRSAGVRRASSSSRRVWSSSRARLASDSRSREPSTSSARDRVQGGRQQVVGGRRVGVGEGLGRGAEEVGEVAHDVVPALLHLRDPGPGQVLHPRVDGGREPEAGAGRASRQGLVGQQLAHQRAVVGRVDDRRDALVDQAQQRRLRHARATGWRARGSRSRSSPSRPKARLKRRHSSSGPTRAAARSRGAPARAAGSPPSGRGCRGSPAPPEPTSRSGCRAPGRGSSPGSGRRRQR